MKDQAAIYANMQSVGHIVQELFPGRGFIFVIVGKEPGDQTSYIGNMPRESSVIIMRQLSEQGMPGLPPSDPSAS